MFAVSTSSNNYNLQEIKIITAALSTQKKRQTERIGPCFQSSAYIHDMHIGWRAYLLIFMYAFCDERLACIFSFAASFQKKRENILCKHFLFLHFVFLLRIVRQGVFPPTTFMEKVSMDLLLFFFTMSDADQTDNNSFGYYNIFFFFFFF